MRWAGVADRCCSRLLNRPALPLVFICILTCIPHAQARKWILPEGGRVRGLYAVGFGHDGVVAKVQSGDAEEIRWLLLDSGTDEPKPVLDFGVSEEKEEGQWTVLKEGFVSFRYKESEKGRFCVFRNAFGEEVRRVRMKPGEVYAGRGMGNDDLTTLGRYDDREWTSFLRIESGLSSVKALSSRDDRRMILRMVSVGDAEEIEFQLPTVPEDRILPRVKGQFSDDYLLGSFCWPMGLMGDSDGGYWGVFTVRGLEGWRDVLVSSRTAEILFLPKDTRFPDPPLTLEDGAGPVLVYAPVWRNKTLPKRIHLTGPVRFTDFPLEGCDRYEKDWTFGWNPDHSVLTASVNHDATGETLFYDRGGTLLHRSVGDTNPYLCWSPDRKRALDWVVSDSDTVLKQAFPENSIIAEFEERGAGDIFWSDKGDRVFALVYDRETTGGVNDYDLYQLEPGFRHLGTVKVESSDWLDHRAWIDSTSRALFRIKSGFFGTDCMQVWTAGFLVLDTESEETVFQDRRGGLGGLWEYTGVSVYFSTDRQVIECVDLRK